VRQKMLYRSVQRLVDSDEQVEHLVYLWSRHRLMVPYSVFAGLVVFIVAWVAGIEQWGGRIACGLGGAAVGAAATSDYRVLVQTNASLVLMKASRFRQVATGVHTRLDSDTVIEPIGTTLVMTEWIVGERQYSVMKRFQQAMVAIAAR